MEPNKFPNQLSSIQRFASGSCQFFYLPFFLAKELWKLTSGLWIQLHRLVQLDRDFVAEFFFSIYDDFSRYSISTNPFGENFATVSAVLSEMATNSAYFETASVKLKMYLLLLPEATDAAIMSKGTR